ncbi:hypothetical protein GUITHDRAFT_143114 [Guillardia theta CCMP2712]|uniref:Uncharacterized protein n=1 Tax=Guillardia theta (strain CCMP2712) TaxID=905079 RepID=L1IUP4_GUITC|nr:hypothetical protein GUITHDRAFT_143114 [Guillardia theta CCMP2712]EKX39953.1 hypothetical protein GUITHDRAFT_143114 [Guillardia theta CCMP2712]|eukprot:XP_005826933.1 hypothetical protein GUITHDRAFT_143114 [Guillardia theta CCMP2712]
MDFFLLACTGEKNVFTVQECCTPSWTRPSWSRSKSNSTTPRSAGRLLSAEVHGPPSRIELFCEDHEEEEGELLPSSRRLAPVALKPATHGNHQQAFHQNLWSSKAAAEQPDHNGPALDRIESESMLLHQLQPSNPTTAEPTPRSVNFSRNHTPRQTREAAAQPSRSEASRVSKAQDVILIECDIVSPASAPPTHRGHEESQGEESNERQEQVPSQSPMKQEDRETFLWA